jgi:hypothetical protein
VVGSQRPLLAVQSISPTYTQTAKHETELSHENELIRAYHRSGSLRHDTGNWKPALFYTKESMIRSVKYLQSYLLQVVIPVGSG